MSVREPTLPPPRWTKTYRIRSPGCCGDWAIIFITGGGVLSTISDYGNYGYWWVTGDGRLSLVHRGAGHGHACGRGLRA
jgi:hypothetical protein